MSDVNVDCKCLKFVAVGCFTRKWLRFYQKISLTSDDLEISLVVIRLGVTILKMTTVVYLLDLCEGRGENGQCDLMRVERLQMIELINGGYVDVLFTCGECGFCFLGSWSYSKEWVHSFLFISILVNWVEAQYA